ncbi:DUF2283 domain-containing protein [Kribbella sp. VKM Ac-2566]|uniref:DUF2283 domain-containing protein n=1 Tax=Kribbella sp. VKM Ac-2566 TaxID=2512218 RepID=UPI001063D294|nr:DUF2283 domain-containing protein [Kribbella sp. VKM Ac-2566]TDW91123.1 uncharacterized protein DUF2283 [Kribbella sp. VKM Ac-2566]
MPSITIEVDTVLDTAYIRLAESPVARTVEHNEEINIDLDSFNVAIGIELLAEGAPVPFTDLVERYHVHTDVVELLRLIRPDVASYLELTKGNDGTTRAHAADHLEIVA